MGSGAPCPFGKGSWGPRGEDEAADEAQSRGLGVRLAPAAARFMMACRAPGKLARDGVWPRTQWREAFVARRSLECSACVSGLIRLILPSRHGEFIPVGRCCPFRGHSGLSQAGGMRGVSPPFAGS